jgi:hypothetical protein
VQGEAGGGGGGGTGGVSSTGPSSSSSSSALTPTPHLSQHPVARPLVPSNQQQSGNSTLSIAPSSAHTSYLKRPMRVRRAVAREALDGGRVERGKRILNWVRVRECGCRRGGVGGSGSGSGGRSASGDVCLSVGEGEGVWA